MKRERKAWFYGKGTVRGNKLHEASSASCADAHLILCKGHARFPVISHTGTLTPHESPVRQTLPRVPFPRGTGSLSGTVTRSQSKARTDGLATLQRASRQSNAQIHGARVSDARRVAGGAGWACPQGLDTAAALSPQALRRHGGCWDRPRVSGRRSSAKSMPGASEWDRRLSEPHWFTIP